MLGARVLFVVSFAVCAFGADVCNPADFQGVYGFLLTGTTTISTQPQPVVSLGRLTFDGAGNVTGIATFSFTGLNLGNPVAGTYEARADCSLSWTLRDESGNAQHFDGIVTSDGRRAEFYQSDPGSPFGGILSKSAETCQGPDFRPRYRFTISGSRIDVDTGQVSGSVAARGLIESQGNQLTVKSTNAPGASSAGSLQVDDDCWVHLDLMVPTETGAVEMNFRGILVNDGAQLLGMATNRGTALSLRLTAP